ADPFEIVVSRFTASSESSLVRWFSLLFPSRLAAHHTRNRGYLCTRVISHYCIQTDLGTELVIMQYVASLRFQCFLTRSIVVTLCRYSFHHWSWNHNGGWLGFSK